MLNGAAELRNKRGTGHGRSGGPLIDAPVARLTAGLVLPAVLYLCEVYEDRTKPDEPREATPIRTRSVPLGRPSESCSVDDIVVHKTFGEGQVVSVQPTEQGPMVHVDFGGDTGVKRLLAKYAGLTVRASAPRDDGSV